MSRAAVTLAMLVSCALIAEPMGRDRDPTFLWNASPSVPIGLYRLTAVSRLEAPDLVVVEPPEPLAGFLAARGYLPRGVPLLKRVVGLPGALVCRSGVFVTVDGVAVARALARDRANRALPVWTGCRTVGSDQLFLINAARDSLDSRYFGPLSAAGLIGTAHPVLIRADARAPLHWRGAASFAEPITTQRKAEP